MMPNTLPTGTLLKNKSYQVVRLLGQGGFGAVYLADDLILENPCAIKESLENSPDAQAQFEVESRILANLNHPHLPRVTDNFIEPSTGLQYLVMEYVEGQNLGDLLARSGTLPETMVRDWADQVLQALAYLHNHKPRPIIHRDVKPDNIRLLPDGKTVKLVDFGIAKLGGAGDATRHGARGATPGFSPPEQYGSGTSPYSDVYALGATLYNLLTNTMPPDAIDRAYAKTRLVPPREINSDIGEELEQIILTAMQLDPSLRFPDAREMRKALKGSRPAEILSECPHCGKPVRPNARFCPSCGQKISTIKPFVLSRSGARATNLVELVRSIDQHWKEALEYFQRGEVDAWLADLSPKGQELAEKSRTLRQTHRDPSVALELFLKSAAPTRPTPILSVQPQNLDFDLLRRGESKSQTLAISNRGHGYLYGSLQSKQAWIKALPPEFGCLPDGEVPVQVQVQTGGLTGTRLSGSVTVASNGGEQTIPVAMQVVEAAPPRPTTAFFLDPNRPGTGASSLQELVQLCDREWDEAVYWLLSRRIEEFLQGIGEERLRQAAEQARLHTEPNAGLEALLRLAGAEPALRFKTNARAVLSQLGYGLFPKTRPRPDSVRLSIQNASRRGYLHGQVQPLAAWLSAPLPGFGCQPGKSAEVELHVDPQKRRAEQFTFRKALFEISLF